MVIFSLLISLFWCVLWGIVVQKVVENKGYGNENWFWWGFFFGIFALIIALTKPQVHEETFEERQWREDDDKRRTIKQGGWECKKCGRIVPHYTGTCACGQSKNNN